MDNFEKHISSLLRNDKLPFGANTAIHSRLMYLMQLKSANSAVRKNEIMPWVRSIFTPGHFAWKLGITAFFLVALIGSGHFYHKTSITHVADTAQIIRSIDTTNFILNDSISFH